MQTFEGDLIRPLGLLTLYAAYAEGELDELLESILRDEPYEDTKRQWTIGRKLKYAIRVARSFGANDLAELVRVLNSGKVLFEKRNTLVHGKLFAGGRLVSNRRACPDQVVSPEKITELAESLFSWKEQLWLRRCKDVLPYLKKANESGT